jgi:hypothetical protein
VRPGTVSTPLVSIRLVGGRLCRPALPTVTGTSTGGAVAADRSDELLPVGAGEVDQGTGVHVHVHEEGRAQAGNGIDLPDEVGDLGLPVGPEPIHRICQAGSLEPVDERARLAEGLTARSSELEVLGISQHPPEVGHERRAPLPFL